MAWNGWSGDINNLVGQGEEIKQELPQEFGNFLDDFAKRSNITKVTCPPFCSTDHGGLDATAYPNSGWCDRECNSRGVTKRDLSCASLVLDLDGKKSQYIVENELDDLKSKVDEFDDWDQLWGGIALPYPGTTGDDQLNKCLGKNVAFRHLQQCSDHGREDGSPML